MRRLGHVAQQVDAIFGGEEILDARDVSTLFTPYDPVVTTRKRAVPDPVSILPNGKSVLVFGVALPHGPDGPDGP
ncbi:MAG: hypothetical protein WC340_07455 [Kiritimatiellia bacterium]